jgi:leucyl-tRNA synthetase
MLLLLMAPSAPHITEELWEQRGMAYSIHSQQWPGYNADLAAEDQIVVAVQVNGKLRDKLTVPADIAEDDVTALALASEKTKAHTDGKTIRKVIYVPGKIVSIVVA